MNKTYFNPGLWLEDSMLSDWSGNHKLIESNIDRLKPGVILRVRSNFKLISILSLVMPDDPLSINGTIEFVDIQTGQTLSTTVLVICQQCIILD